MSDIDNLLNILLSSSGNSKDSQTDSKENKDNEEISDGGFPDGIDLDMIMKLGEIMSKLGENDKNTELLIALKPHLREENRAKIDTAVRLFRLVSLLPYLKDSGLFDNLF